MNQYDYNISIKNCGIINLNCKLKSGSGEPDPLISPAGGQGSGKYNPNSDGYVEFVVTPEKPNGRKHLRLIMPIDSDKDGCHLITEKGNKKFLLRIYLIESRPDTNVEVGIEEPTRPPIQKQKPEGK